MKRFLRLFAFATLIMTFISCNKQKMVGDNPFFEEVWQTPYGVPPFDRIEFEHYKPAFERGMSLHNEEITAIVENKQEPTFENTILAYDNSGQMLYRVSTVFEMLAAADTDEQMQALSAEIMPQMAAHDDAIMMNDALFERIKSVYDRRFALNLDAEQLRLTEKIFRSFERSGALLSAEDKARLKQINERLTSLGVDFGRNVLAETNAFTVEPTLEELLGVPMQVRDAAEEYGRSIDKKGTAVFTLQKPSMLPLLTYTQSRELREKVYSAYLMRGNNGGEHDNNDIIAEMVSLRYEKAKLLGYDSYAHYVISDEMATTPEAVYELLNQVWDPALERAKQELERLKTLYRREKGNANDFKSWDWWYYAEKVRNSDYNLKEEDVREYLSLDNVKGGIFFLCNRLYGITFRPLKAPTYHPECEVYEVIDSDDTPLGALYMDFYPRASKAGGAWCGTYVEQSYKDGKRVLPVVSIVCNFTRPVGSAPALLSIDETKTFFHEFGHALHSLFADVKYRGLSNVEGDFVELPSQIMENWAFATPMLKQYAVHYRKGDVMPDDMIRKIHESAKFNEGFNTTELVAAALSDLDIHSLQSAEKIDVAEFEREALTEKRGLIPQIEPRYHYTYFSHIFDGGYSAGYYFYIWAEVLDKDAYQAFVESGDIFDKATAERFRREVLSKGGTRAGMDMYRAFRGADPNKIAMLVARGLVEPEEIADVEPLPVNEIVRVDTREQARQRAERSRREREAARLQAKADSLAAVDSLQSVELKPIERATPMQLGLEPIKK
ncbi:MAG: M3 family metallopeptidase [Alistipes sp.]|nr:M3 family metallopeptidase [Alistipes sp.]